MFADESTPVGRLKDLVRAFSDERNWAQFHTPKDLGIALVCEVGELFEHFRYRRDDEIAALLNDPSKKQAVADELADCLWLLLRMADVTGIDLASSLEAKVEAAGVKYPVAKAYGRPDKYTAYTDESKDQMPDGK